MAMVWTSEAVTSDVTAKVEQFEFQFDSQFESGCEIKLYL